MAKKEQPKPIFPLKHEFYSSLDHTLQCAIALHQVVATAIELKAVDGRVLETLKDRNDRLAKAFGYVG